MLSTARGGSKKLLSYHHKRLRQVVEHRLRYAGIEFVQVSTDEGNGVLHIIWAWKGERSFYIDQRWLSAEWERIHGAPVVWISRIGDSRKDAHFTSRYMVTQYCVEQNGFKRLSWSWGKLPVAIARAWQALKVLASEQVYHECRAYSHLVVPMAEVVAAWEHLLADGWCTLGEMLIEVRGRTAIEVF